jgi:hypothetical protein
LRLLSARDHGLATGLPFPKPQLLHADFGACAVALEADSDGFEALMGSRHAILEVSDGFGAKTAVKTGLDTELKHLGAVSFLDEGASVYFADSIFQESTGRALVAVAGMLCGCLGKHGQQVLGE